MKIYMFHYTTKEYPIRLIFQKNIIHSRHQNIPNRSDLTSTLNSSIISCHISYLTNNSDTYNQPKFRLKHWGIHQRFHQINSLLPNNDNDSSSKLIFDFAFGILIKF